MIAMGLALVDILIADEPTSALDVTVQSQILELLAKLQEEKGMALLIVSHDLGVIAEWTDEIAVMYGGRIVEQGTSDAVIERPMHPHTGPARVHPPCRRAALERLTPIPGAPPSGQPAAGLRVPSEMLARPAVLPGACSGARAGRREPPHRLSGGERGPVTPVASTRLLVVEDLVKHFPARGTQRQRGTVVHAVDGVSFTIAPAETLGLVGETGCGKSTVARLVTRLLEPTGGRIEFESQDITHWSRRKLRPLRRDADRLPGSVLLAQPRRRVGSIIGAPLTHTASGHAASSGQGCGRCWSASGSIRPTSTATRTSSPADSVSE